jgi:hypothetical protein
MLITRVDQFAGRDHRWVLPDFWRSPIWRPAGPSISRDARATVGRDFARRTTKGRQGMKPFKILERFMKPGGMKSRRIPFSLVAESSMYCYS